MPQELTLPLFPYTSGINVMQKWRIQIWHYQCLQAIGNAAIRNPKRNRSCNVGRAAWYPYYAGYSPDFVSDAIGVAQRHGYGRYVLDPWNGSGTTTEVASLNGLKSQGFDLNPAMVIVAKARSLNFNEGPSIPSLLDHICQQAIKVKMLLPRDPLLAWLNSNTASAFRSIDRAISTLLVNSQCYTPLAELPVLSSVSPLACYFYVALFRLLRSALGPFFASNPTWIKSAESSVDRVNIRLQDVLGLFRREVFYMLTALKEVTYSTNTNWVTPFVEVANSLKLPVESGTFDVAVTSPPYCTRIDYAVKTGPELAIMGITAKSMRSLRDSMIGTPTVAGTPERALPEWGSICKTTLAGIENHTSRASRSYYWKTYIQYFDRLFKSLREVRRVLCSPGLFFLVVQNSYYKDLHVDLAGIAEQMLWNLELRSKSKLQFASKRTMAGLNTRARAYQEIHAHTESVLVFEKYA